MTTTTDSMEHPDVAEISDLTEGLLAPSRALDVRQHLDDCALCTDVYASLEEIRGMLGTLPGPSRMPTDVAERIDAALAAEALLDTTVATDGSLHHAQGPGRESRETSQEPIRQTRRQSGQQSDSTGHRETSAETPVDVSRETSTAASDTPLSSAKPLPSAAAAAASDGAPHGGDVRGPTGHARGATGPGRGGRARNRRRRTTVLGAVFTAAALGIGALLVQPWDSDSTGSNETASGRSEDPHSFTKGKLEDRVAKLLGGQKSIGSGRTPADGPSISSKSSPGGIERGDTKRDGFVSVPDCVERGLGGRTPLAAEKGVYDGKNSYLVVVPHDSDGTKVSAYIVDAACVSAAASPNATGKVLLTESFARN
ncbi:hypothetical protein RB200_09990 [Streptomyces sp. PmtG]